eukprot:gene6387-11826_t
MIVQYLKDVSAMLCLISSVRENTIERHLAAERALIPKCFAFGHPNYARYLSFQHVNLLDIKRNHATIWQDLLENEYGGSVSCESFSTMHGELITEMTINREVTARGGPMQGGFSTDITAVDTFMKTSHFIANLRMKLKERLRVFTTSSHKETSVGARKKHEIMIQSLINKLDSYFDPFLASPARHFKTGCQIDEAVKTGLLLSTQMVNEIFKEFFQKRLKNANDRASIFERVCNPKLKTGLEKVKKVPKIISSLKEDRQAFGAMIGKNKSTEELLSYPLASVPLALASPDGDLRQGSKAALRKHLIEEANASTTQPETGAFWIVDGMAVVRTILRKNTWENRSRLIRIPTIITENEKSWLLTTTSITELEDCNHFEADTRLIYVATQVDDMPVIISATDTDVLVLMVHIYSWRDIDRPWQMKIDHQNFVNVAAIADHIGSEACNVLPAFHSITGCDTTSFPFRVGKVAPWKKLMKMRLYDLLSTFGCRFLTDDSLLAAKESFRSIMYNGEIKESYLDTRVRIYQKQKLKSSEGIIPDENSAMQHLKRSWLQCYVWCHCTESQIDFPTIDETFGWSQNVGFIKPLWYSCSQFPPDMTDINEEAEIYEKRIRTKEAEERNVEVESLFTTLTSEDEFDETGEKDEEQEKEAKEEDNYEDDWDSDSSFGDLH